MDITIDWFAFVQVFAAALVGALLVVGFYAVGLRLLVRAGRAPVVAPAEFTDAITVITEKEAQRAAKAAAKSSVVRRQGSWSFGSNTSCSQRPARIMFSTIDFIGAKPVPDARSTAGTSSRSPRLNWPTSRSRPSPSPSSSC